MRPNGSLTRTGAGEDVPAILPRLARPPAPRLLAALASCAALIPLPVAGGWFAGAPGGLWGFGQLALLISDGPLTELMWLAVSTAAITIGAVLTGRWWPYHLAGGALVVTVPTVVVALHDAGSGAVPHPVLLLALRLGGEVLVLLGALAAAQALIRDGYAGAGATVAAAAVGAGLAGTLLTPGRILLLLLCLGALAGAAASVVLASFPGPVERAGSPAAASVAHTGTAIADRATTDRATADRATADRATADRATAGAGAGRVRVEYTRVLVAGVAGAAAALLPQLIVRGRLYELLGVTTDQVGRHPATFLTAVGALLVLVALVLAAGAGPVPLLATASVALIQLGTAGPIRVVGLELASHPLLGWGVAATGLVTGLLATTVRWRAWLAGGLCLLTAAALLAVSATDRPRGGQYDRLLIMVAVLGLAATVAMAGCAAPVLARRQALPVVLGPLVALLLTGAGPLLTLRNIHDAAANQDLFTLALSSLPANAALCLAAASGAAVFGGIGMLTTGAHQPRAGGQPDQAAGGTQPVVGGDQR